MAYGRMTSISVDPAQGRESLDKPSPSLGVLFRSDRAPPVTRITFMASGRI
ncbi:MAG TPA: hypothetical protein VME86_02350 [Acidobacteriaceae bacterium]|nr:hypothetical protein [Acidobacteriaceae bacterium]